MSQSLPYSVESFIDRRGPQSGQDAGRERRQFGDARAELSAPAKELADAIDQYKLLHRRRFITFEEMLSVIESLGYRKA